MYIIYIIILLTSLFLTFYANLSLWLSIPLFIVAILGLFFELRDFLRSSLLTKNLITQFKLKWVGKFVLLEGLNLVPNQDLYLGLTRRESLMFFSTQQETQISLEKIDGMLSIKGSDLLELSDDRIHTLLNRTSEMSVYTYVKNLISDTNYLRKKNILLISLKSNNKSKNRRMNTDLIVLIQASDAKHFKKFAKSPEVRSKLRVHYNKNSEIHFAKNDYQETN